MPQYIAADSLARRSTLPETVLTMLRGALLAQRDDAERRLTVQRSGNGLTDHTGARAREVVEQCDEALQRMQRGTYGRCEACGRSIPIDRLEAVPYTRTCSRCPGVLRGLLG